MKNKGLLCLVFTFFVQFIFSQDSSLSILTIPDSLTRNCNSVIRFDETNIELISQRKMVITVRKAITILNKLGDGKSNIMLGYDKNKRIKSLKAIVYNSVGTDVKKISKKDFKDYAAADGISLYNDGRLKYYEYVPVSYPYTMYYEYEIESANTAFIPKWNPINSYLQSVEQSTFKITYPNDLVLKKTENLIKEFNIKLLKESNSFQYTSIGIVAIKPEEYSPSIDKFVPSVKFMTNKFSVEGIDGEATNWTELGQWEYHNFYKNVGQLPNSTKELIKNLVGDVQSPIEKAKIVYKYVQDKTRYISVQVGIGGLKPMLVQDVDKLGYGDCKALTNYTKSLLEVVNVESYFTELYGGYENIDMDYNSPSIQGNHVILNVPTESEDIWLECTSQKVPFGYIANFTDDRNVIVIKPEGGILKRTTKYNDESSIQYTKASYGISSEGNLSAKLAIESSGTQYDRHFILEKQSEREINKYYKSNYWSYINNLVVNDYAFNNDRDQIIFHENVGVMAEDYATFSGDRMLFILNAFNRTTRIPKRYRNRKLPLEISRGFKDIDQFEITLPENYNIEALAENVSIKNKFGEYIFSIEKMGPSKLKYSRTFLLKKGMYPKQDYKTYRNFRKQIAKHDKTKIVLIKK